MSNILKSCLIISSLLLTSSVAFSNEATPEVINQEAKVVASENLKSNEAIANKDDAKIHKSKKKKKNKRIKKEKKYKRVKKSKKHTTETEVPVEIATKAAVN